MEFIPSKHDSIQLILYSIGIEEISLGHLIDSESMLIDHLLKYPIHLDDFLFINQSLLTILKVCAEKEQILYQKLKTVLSEKQNIKVVTSEYITISDGEQRIYTNHDGIDEFKCIKDPNTVSQMNLFINGVLQPESYYQVEEGLLRLKTEDIPIKGTFIILQFITMNS